MKKYQKGFAPILIMLILAVAAAGYFAYQNYQLRKTVNNPSPSVSPTSISTTDWKTYSNPTLGVSFNYPSDNTVSEYPTLVTVHPDTATDVWYLEVQKISNTTILKEYSNDKLSGNTQSIGPLTDTLINGVKTKKTNVSSNGTEIDIYYFQSETSVFKILSPISDPPNSISSKILSTFKFTDSVTSDYKCPENGWVNCMPILNAEGQKACSNEALLWYKANCPNFQGVAQ